MNFELTPDMKKLLDVANERDSIYEYVGMAERNKKLVEVEIRVTCRIRTEGEKGDIETISWHPWWIVQKVNLLYRPCWLTFGHFKSHMTYLPDQGRGLPFKEALALFIETYDKEMSKVVSNV
jgi:hypothetical protein